MDHIPSFEITTYDFAAKHYSDWIFPMTITISTFWKTARTPTSGKPMT